MMIHIFPALETQVIYICVCVFLVMSRTCFDISESLENPWLCLYVCICEWNDRHYTLSLRSHQWSVTHPYTRRRRIAHTANSPQYTIRSAVNSNTAQKVVDILGQLIASLRLIDLTAGAMETRVVKSAINSALQTLPSSEETSLSTSDS